MKTYKYTPVKCEKKKKEKKEKLGDDLHIRM